MLPRELHRSIVLGSAIYTVGGSTEDSSKSGTVEKWEWNGDSFEKSTRDYDYSGTYVNGPVVFKVRVAR